MSKKLMIRYTGSGADLLGRWLLWSLLTVITVGIYAPWAVNGFCRYVIEHIEAEVAE